MGQGNKSTVDVRKASPRRGRRQGHAEAGQHGESGDGARPHYCELAHTLSVTIEGGASLSVGSPVELALASPPRVLSAGRDVGEVDDRKARAMERCIVDGFPMSGTVRRLSADGQRGQIVVSGASAS